MWLYPEVLPRRPKIRLWMLAPAAVLAVAIVAVLAVPHDDAAISQVAVIKANLGRVHSARVEAELGVQIARIDYVLARLGACRSDCAEEHELVIRNRARLSAGLRALRTRVSLAPQRTTGIALPPACLQNPRAAGCE
jgi:hypothetical protein